MTMLEWKAGQVFGRDTENKTVFVHLNASDPLNAGGIREECWTTIQIQRGPEDDYSEPSIRQAALERLRDLVATELHAIYASCAAIDNPE
jgi:hypothetical protein